MQLHRHRRARRRPGPRASAATAARRRSAAVAAMEARRRRSAAVAVMVARARGCLCSAARLPRAAGCAVEAATPVPSATEGPPRRGPPPASWGCRGARGCRGSVGVAAATERLLLPPRAAGCCARSVPPAPCRTASLVQALACRSEPLSLTPGSLENCVFEGQPEADASRGRGTRGFSVRELARDEASRLFW